MEQAAFICVFVYAYMSIKKESMEVRSEVNVRHSLIFNIRGKKIWVKYRSGVDIYSNLP